MPPSAHRGARVARVGSVWEPLPRHSRAAAGMALALQCCRAVGPRAAGDRSGSAAPWGCRLLPLPCSVCRSLPTHTGGCILDGDTDPCQGQLGEINMPGLKGLRVARAGAGCDSRAPCLALLAFVGHGVPEQPRGSACPGTVCPACPGTVCSAAVSLCHSCLSLGQHWGHRAELALPARCAAWGCGGGSRCTCMHGCILPAGRACV